jgi:hypothetical protein
MVVNARWVPYILGDGVADELVPVSSVLQQVQTFLNDGNRVHFELYPAEDHMVFATQDGFSSEISQLGTTTRVTNPGRITYAWYPVLQDPKLGLGPTGVYWVRGISGRTGSTLAKLDVQSDALPNPSITTEQSQSANVPGDPTPAVVVDQTWKLGPSLSKRSPLLTMSLTNVATIGIDMARAKLSRSTVRITTDGPTVVRLLDLRPGLRVAGAGHAVRVSRDGVVVVRVGTGTTTVFVR